MKQNRFLAMALAGTLSLSTAALASDGFADRSDAAQALYNLGGKPAVTGASVFSDDQSPAALWCGQTGIVQGDGSGLFRGERTLTQAELVTLLYRYAQLQGKGFTGLWAFNLGYDVPEWSYESYCWCTMNGVTTLVQPDALVTDDELATTLAAFQPLVETQEKSGLIQLQGKAATVSKSGNVTTDITKEMVDASGMKLGDMLVLLHGEDRIELPFVSSYTDVDMSAPLARISSKGVLVLAINNGVIAEKYNIQEGDSLTLEVSEKEGYLEEYTLRNLDSLRTNDRADYTTDEVFANFRPVVMGDIAAGRLYRTSSPVNPKLGRNTYAGALAEAAGVKTILNMADTEEEMLAFEGVDLQKLQQVNYVCLAMPMDYLSQDFTEKLKTGLEFLLSHEGPYLFHCTEGKDRTGFLAMVFESLMGGEEEAILDDYMLTYENFYHIEKGSDRWNRIRERSGKAILDNMRGDAPTLRQGAENYLTQKVGLTMEQVNELIEKLK